jgi:hypothetical protein
MPRAKNKEAAVGSQNRTVSPNEAKSALTHCIKLQRPIMMWGAPGIGKSDIVKQIAGSEGREVIDIRLPLWEPTDIKGIPYYNAKENNMVWASPAELPTDPKSNAIVFLDELNSAAPAVQAAAYQLILNRREKENFEDWLQWATDQHIHADVVGYCTFAKQDLYDFDPRGSSRSFATPRSWSFVSQLLSDDLPESTLTDLVAGCVGEGLAVKFMNHRKISGQLPNPSDILSGKVKDLKSKEISAMYSLTVSLCYELQQAHEKKDKTWNDQADRFFNYMMDNFETELVVMGAKIALTNYKLPFDPSKLKSFDRFHKKFGKYVITAMESK